MTTLLWLDDIRSPFTPVFILQYAPEYYYEQGEGTHKVVWVKNYTEFVEWITENGLPDKIGFDHDLADIKSIEGSDLVLASDWNKEKTGMDCAKWLVEYCMDNDEDLPDYFIQSANPVGSENIHKLLTAFKEFE